MATSQIEAACRLHDRLPGWSMTDRICEQLNHSIPGFELEAALLKAAVLDRLYRTNVYAILPMAEHVANVLADPPDDPIGIVEAIAALPPLPDTPARQYFSFASKFVQFSHPDDVPILDKWAERAASSISSLPRSRRRHGVHGNTTPVASLGGEPQSLRRGLRPRWRALLRSPRNYGRPTRRGHPSPPHQWR